MAKEPSLSNYSLIAEYRRDRSSPFLVTLVRTNCKQLYPEFDLGSSCPSRETIAVTPCVYIYIYIYIYILNDICYGKKKTGK